MFYIFLIYGICKKSKINIVTQNFYLAILNHKLAVFSSVVTLKMALAFLYECNKKL